MEALTLQNLQSHSTPAALCEFTALSCRCGGWLRDLGRLGWLCHSSGGGRSGDGSSGGGGSGGGGSGGGAFSPPDWRCIWQGHVVGLVASPPSLMFHASEEGLQQ